MLRLPLVALGLVVISAYAKPTIRTVGGLEVSPMMGLFPA